MYQAPGNFRASVEMTCILQSVTVLSKILFSGVATSAQAHNAVVASRGTSSFVGSTYWEVDRDPTFNQSYQLLAF